MIKMLSVDEKRKGIAASGEKGWRDLSPAPTTAGISAKGGPVSTLGPAAEKSTGVKNVIGFSEIKARYLAHRYPIIMLDRITDFRPGQFAEAIKCVTGNSPELVGHFPDRAIMPATFIIQALAQLAIVFIQLSLGPLKEDEMTVVSTTKFKFFAPVFPGDTLRLMITPSRLEDGVGLFNGNARVDTKSVVRGNLTLAKTKISKFGNPPW
jgi:3-hydroxyacyl-[acyl-carrier-protein] dehydratase